MKRIGIDVYSALHTPRGMGIYTINFLNELAKIDKVNEYILYADISDEKNVLPMQSNFTFKLLKAKGLLHYEQFVLPKQAEKDKLDILHSPANTSPILLNKKITRFLTLHDVIFLKKEVPLPNNIKQLFGRLYYIITAILNAKKANIIFTPTEYSKKDISETLNICENKIFVTPNGHEHFDISEATEIGELVEKYGISCPYYFHLGGEAPSKNSEMVLKYFEQNQDKKLVFAGIKNLNSSVLYNKYKSCQNIKFVSYIPQKDLVGLYKNAEAFIFSSIYEGFGIPLVEAMKCNCPIICSNASCLPEVAGEVAVYFNPRNMKSFSDIFESINKEEMINKTTQNSALQLDKYTWKKTANIICEEYNATK